MSGASIFALIALGPAAFGIAAPAATVTVALCDGSNEARTIDIPLQRAPGGNGDCHVKGCHAGNSRKRCHI